MYPKDTVEFYPNNIPDFLAKAKAHPSVVPLQVLTREEKLERRQAYNREHREHKLAYQRVYNQSEAN